MRRSEMREHIFKLLFMSEFNTPEEMPEQLMLYFQDMEELSGEEQAYMEQKYERVRSRIPEIDALLNDTAYGWRTGRMNRVDLATLRLAIYEIRFDDDVPTGVAINEAVLLAKKFGGEDSSSFVNGILGKVQRQSEAGKE